MSRELDRRDLRVNRVTPEREARLRGLTPGVSALLPERQQISIASFDPTTGNPDLIVSQGAPAEKGNYVQRALQHVQALRDLLGLTPTQPAEFAADPNFQETSSGAVAVHLQQQYKGIPIFTAALTVRFEPRGALTETAGSAVSVAQDVSALPKLSVQQAVRKAAEHVAVPHPDERGARDPFGEPLYLPSVDAAALEPTVLAAFPDVPNQPTLLDAGPFGERIKASLTWFPLGDDLRLAWQVILTLPAYQGQYRTLVDAQSGDILYCRQLVQTVAARGNVYQSDGGSPRQLTDFPLPLAAYGLPLPGDLPAGFPDTWVEVDRTVGNSVRAHLDVSGPPMQGAPQGGVVVFDPTDPAGDHQKILNIFYYNCYMHDYFYLLRFREVDGNFQQDNFGRGGVSTDRVEARAHAGPVWGTANMATPVDGLSPLMNMGLVAGTGRHTAFDSTVVFHEFMHGVTNRLVGGPMNDQALEAPQSGGMGEGWGDYIACTINNTLVVGAWVVNRPGGIRGFPYDSNFPDKFDRLGTGRYTEVHNIGEIWCATLLEVNRRITKALAVQLVVDALKLSPANPSFLHMRDAILAALDHKRDAGQLPVSEHATARKGIWQAFAKFGMGPQARSNGASLWGIVADFNPPPDGPPPEPTGAVVRGETAPALLIPDANPAGVSSTIAVAPTGTAQALKVGVDIAHTYIGDLQVELVAPSGQKAVLHNRRGGSQHNLVTTYDSAATPALAALVGQPIQGDWVLRVRDLEALDIGVLNKWSLELTYPG